MNPNDPLGYLPKLKLPLKLKEIKNQLVALGFGASHPLMKVGTYPVNLHIYQTPKDREIHTVIYQTKNKYMRVIKDNKILLKTRDPEEVINYVKTLLLIT